MTDHMYLSICNDTTDAGEKITTLQPTNYETCLQSYQFGLAILVELDSQFTTDLVLNILLKDKSILLMFFLSLFFNGEVYCREYIDGSTRGGSTLIWGWSPPSDWVHFQKPLEKSGPLPKPT